MLRLFMTSVESKTRGRAIKKHNFPATGKRYQSNSVYIKIQTDDIYIYLYKKSKRAAFTVDQ